MHYSQIYWTLKSILAKLTGRSSSEIFADQNLVTDLRFTDQGKASLNADINRGFADENFPISPALRPGETRNAATVRDLYKLISKRF
ncbi:hypothetical protein N9W89_08675 [Hellea sp.]|nr:hypothetical protein [Hellea sp.]